jgi:hypothetical protein
VVIMRTLLFWAVGAMVAGSFAACVGSDPASSTAAQGAQNGACFSNGTCNPGLSCDAVSGTCAVGDDASSSDGGSGDSTTTNDSGGPPIVDEAGVLSCSFNTSFYPCDTTNLPVQNTCYGDQFMCSTSGCGGNNNIIFGCFSPNQCSSGIPCCVPIAGNSLHAGTTCAEGTLTFADGGGIGSQCGSAKGDCPPTDYQLCQTNKQCPTGQRCNLVKLSGSITLDSPDGGTNSSVDIGACVPD